jgi:hypothetical protein
MLGSLLGMVSKLTEEVARLNKDSDDFKCKIKDLLELVTGPIGSSGNVSHNDEVYVRALLLQLKSYKEAVVSR